MTSREILDAFARGLEEAGRPFYSRGERSAVEQPSIPSAMGMAEDAPAFDRSI
jgi:hypothetical protein